MSEKTLRYHYFATPLGWILMASDMEGICFLHICGREAPDEQEINRLLRRDYPDAVLVHDAGLPSLRSAADAVSAYLEDGALLPSLSISLRKGTPFQREVWKALREIPFGETRSYQEIAEAIGRPRSARAVGQACGKNPVAVLVPCHRVVAAGGKLGGYSGGLRIKKALLGLEQKRVSTHRAGG